MIRGKTKVILIIILNMLILSSCNKTNINKSIGDEIAEIKQSDIEELFLNITSQTLEKYEGINVGDIIIEEDSLLLNQGNHLNTVNNILVKILLGINDDYDDIEEIKNSFENDLLDKLTEKNRTEITRIRNIKFIYPDESLNSEVVSLETSKDINNLSNIKNEELIKLNKYIYDIFNENIKSRNDEAEYKIIRMGKKENYFIMESTIYYYDSDDYEAVLNDINSEIIDNMNNNVDIRKILEKHKIDKIEFIYNAKWYEYGEPIKFDYELKK